jgi:signal transduction histidine kinase
MTARGPFSHGWCQAPDSGRLVSLGLAAKHAQERWEVRSEQQDRRLELTPADDVVVHSSEEDLAIVLDNLIENALHYSERGTVTVECGRDGNEVYLAVSDEGPGLEPGEEQDVFERFTRGSGGSRTPGTGLGLALVATLARRWGGSAAIANRPEGGARAEVRFPAASLQIPNRDLGEALPGRV